ncbi:uncharacterized protein CG7065 isoform X2 [Bicyclus anynana]|uniref:Uncharacterized protein CG7065 isoform X2 n=1 Tax=Bicyclus anynana TaxID=110368 RepID=A0ABM3M7J0_BICAN|nr:uncharacterized protein CG7065 isoform X2 [Bicyclus anynana]
MDLPDCPPGAEGYEDTVTEIPKIKPGLENLPSSTCTKAEHEFKEHLNSLKIKVEDGSIRNMAERRGRDISGKWIYLCYPCGSVCSGETVFQTHISGKKHKSKLASRNIWPLSIYETHPCIQNEKGVKTNSDVTDTVVKKMAASIEVTQAPVSEMDKKYGKYVGVPCHIQETLDNVKAPLLGVEYLIEHPPEQAHYEPSYICVLCIKQGHPRTIVNHLTCFWHRYNYLETSTGDRTYYLRHCATEAVKVWFLVFELRCCTMQMRHFQTAGALLTPYRRQSQNKYREGISVVINRISQRIQDTYGRLKPVNIDKEEYEKDKEQIHQWLFKGFHFSETKDCTFEEIVDPDLITSLDSTKVPTSKKRDPSPPVVAAPTKPGGYHFNASKRGKPIDLEALSDVSDEPDVHPLRDARVHRNKPQPKRYEPYADKRRAQSPPRPRYSARNAPFKRDDEKEARPPNYAYKLKLAADQRATAETLARKALAYHEKNPEKHPLYPEEWKKFWNRRYKEIQAEGGDPSKHDFKPEWIVFWTTRMKELHEDEMRSTVGEIYRRLRVTPPDAPERLPDKRKSQDRRKSPERRRSVDRRRSPDVSRRRSPEQRRRSPPRRRSPEPRRPPHRRGSPEPRRRTPEYRDRRDHRSPQRNPSPPVQRRSPLRLLRTRSRSPLPRSQNPSPPRKARSPLSRRESAPRNHSPGTKNLTPLSDTVLVSDDELKPDDGLSPWNSEDSMGSILERSPVTHRSRTGSVASRASRRHDKYSMKPSIAPQDFGSAENVVATLRLLVALEDYLGSLGPKIVDLLAEALKMEKGKANSSEEMLEQEGSVVLIETAKEKLKGAVQAGLVSGSAAAAVRAAVVRAAATLHEADKRIRNKKQEAEALAAQALAVRKKRVRCRPRIRPRRAARMRAAAASAASAGAAGGGRAALPVAGVGEVNREQIAQQMAAALIAQGKTDVSSEELAQLVDAVVGMAEAKKREADSKTKTEARAENNKSTRATAPGAVSGTASALQMLQSAYDDKKVEKEDAPDAMDGLSDSDLETLLKNFNELSAEEQHSLIAYLKKLEAREPERVERLRQYVSAAASSAPPEPVAEPVKDNKDSKESTDSLEPVTIESDDDDDYTVEDVFKSATEKVKENRIRQEMEIVKKSLEETKSSVPEKSPVTTSEITNVTKSMSSATDLMALVQSALQQTPALTSFQNKTSDVVSSSTQPRSFGDLPEALPMDKLKQLIPSLSFDISTSKPTAAQNLPNQSENRAIQSTSHAPVWEPRQTPEDFNRGANTQQEHDSYQGSRDLNQNPQGFQNNYNEVPQDSYNQGAQDNNQGAQDNYNQGAQDNYNQGAQDNYNQGAQDSYNQGAQDSYNQGAPGSYNQGAQDNYNQTPQDSYNQGPQDRYNQGPQDSYNQAPQDSYNQVPLDSYNQGSLDAYSHGPQNSYNQGLQDNYQGSSNFNQGFRGGQDNFNQGYRGSQNNFNHGPRGGGNNYNPGQRGPHDNFNQNQRGPLIQGNQNNFNQGPPNNFNQGPRGPPGNQFSGNFKGQIPTRGTHDNSYNNQGMRGGFPRNQLNQQFGNQQKNFRGRGGRGGPRGRGRGNF